MLFFIQSNGQKEDYIWLSGYDSYTGYDTVWHSLFGSTVINFNYSPAQISYDTLSMNFGRTNINYSDTEGNIMFYSNGIYIANKWDEMVANSDSLNAGYVNLVWDTFAFTQGYVNIQGMIALPDPSNKNQYYLAHTYLDTLPFQLGSGIYCAKTLSTLLNMSNNNGHGKVIYKNQPLIVDSLDGVLTAVRHGNGRDWWTLVKQMGSNCYYEILTDTAGVHVQPSLVCAGPAVYNLNDGGSVVFSPDGTKFVYANMDSGVVIYDFDRCSGELSNPNFIPLNMHILDSGWVSNGVAISPNNRFLYLTDTYFLFQFDLQSADVEASIDTVGVFDRFLWDNALATGFWTEQLAPDGKIYISTGNTTPFYHVINNPDLKGDSCNFVQRGDTLPSPSACVPNFPNYRLGRLVGSPCDTIYKTDTTGVGLAGINKEKFIKVFPNPASDYVVVDYGFNDWGKGAITLEISNELGQILFSKELPMYSGFQKIDISQFANGFYTVAIKRQNGIAAEGKFVKQ